MVNVTQIKKDILTVRCGIICHQVNCIGAIGGLAGAIAREWPKNAKEYKAYIAKRIESQSAITLLGEANIVSVGNNLRVANLFGQYGIGTHERQTDYCALYQSLHKVAFRNISSDDCETVLTCFGPEDLPGELNEVYIPYKIGSGLGGGDWNLVNEIIHEAFKNSDKIVYICNNEN